VGHDLQRNPVDLPGLRRHPEFWKRLRAAGRWDRRPTLAKPRGRYLRWRPRAAAFIMNCPDRADRTGYGAAGPPASVGIANAPLPSVAAVRKGFCNDLSGIRADRTGYGNFGHALKRVSEHHARGCGCPG
jgi:hypothetical protein